MEIGKIKFFNGIEGYGFIKVEDDPKKVFVHQSAVNRRNSAYTTLCKGDTVEFERIDSKRGPKAKNVRIIDPAF